jgi:hypothetical protein
VGMMFWALQGINECEFCVRRERPMGCKGRGYSALLLTNKPLRAESLQCATMTFVMQYDVDSAQKECSAPRFSSTVGTLGKKKVSLSTVRSKSFIRPDL